jgi:putative lipase involved disintegration of autophagic bodies
MDILTDINLIRSKTDLCGKANKKDGCLVHDGFHSAMKDAAVVVVPAVEAALKKYPNHKVIATGHSLGGAVSALLGTLLRNRGHNVDIVR